MHLFKPVPSPRGCPPARLATAGYRCCFSVSTSLEIGSSKYPTKKQSRWECACLTKLRFMRFLACEPAHVQRPPPRRFTRHNSAPSQMEPASRHRHTGSKTPCRYVTRFKRVTSSNVLEKADHDANIRHTLFIVAITDNPPTAELYEHLLDGRRSTSDRRSPQMMKRVGGGP